eukprot:3511193-Pyramimonas_sp.AAC.1
MLHAARECGWGKSPRGVVSSKSCRGIAGGCPIDSENPCWHGVSGLMPHSTDRELTNIIGAPWQSKDANEGPGEDDLVDIDVPPEFDPEDAE